VNAVVPGYIADTEFFGDRMTQERHQRLVSRTLLGRPGTPGDVAGAVYFLASEEATYITGQMLHINGGALLGR
jgi:3-oxoacyl-[acyl-carrier protein] reductase